MWRDPGIVRECRVSRREDGIDRAADRRRLGGKRLKVVLYNPYAVFFTMPLALLAIGSELDPAIYEVVTVDARIDPDAENTVLSHIDEALCLGVTVLTGAPISDALRISRAAKRARRDLPVVWGGWHPSMFSRECLLEPSVDVTVRGQGEETFAEIVAAAGDKAVRWRVAQAARCGSPMAPFGKTLRGRWRRSTNSGRTTMA